MSDSIIKIPGYKIPGYQIKHEIGRGGMATVYLALQESLHRQVALKVMNPALSADENFKTRFLNEGHIVGQLNHSNIVTIFDIGTHETHYYLSMEYLPGGSLRDRIRSKLSVEEALQIARTLGKALSYAHNRNFVHRDIKPLNVLFRDDDSPVLTDFGIAKALGSSSQLTRTGYAFGSVGYMSPEQALGKPIDHRSDIYSFGAMLWEMLTGTKLYQSGDAFSLALKHATAPIPRLPDEMLQLQPLLERLLAKDANDRFENMDAFLKELDAHIQGNGPTMVTANAARSRESVVDGHADNGNEATILQNNQNQPSTVTPSPPTGPKTSNARAIVAAVLVLAVTGGGTLWLLPELNPFRPAEPPAIAETPTPEPEPSPVVVATPEAVPEPAEPDEPTVVAEQEPSVDELLALAERQWQAEHYTEPADDNAFATYQRIIEQEPDNATARERLMAIGRLRIGQQYEQQARELLAIGDLDGGLRQVEQGLRLSPDYAPLQALREQVEQRIMEGETVADLPEDTPVDAGETDIDALLARARAHREAGRHTEPAGNNAYQIYQQILELEPDNPVARRGLTEIGRIRVADRLRSEAEALIDDGDIQGGLSAIERGLRLFPDHSGLLELRQAAETRLETR